MSILMLEVAGHFYLNGEQVGEKTTVIRLSNGKQIKIEQDVLYAIKHSKKSAKESIVDFLSEYTGTPKEHYSDREVV